MRKPRIQKRAWFHALSVVAFVLSFSFGQQQQQEDPLVCRVTVHGIVYERDNTASSEEASSTLLQDEPRPSHIYTCNPVQSDGFISELQYELHGREMQLLLEQQDYRSSIASGENIFLSIPGGRLLTSFQKAAAASVIVPDVQAVQVVDAPPVVKARRRRRRRLNRRLRVPNFQGRLTALMVRITTRDATPFYTAEELYHRTFQDIDLSLKSQLQKCSFGKVQLEPTQYGVMQVTVDLLAQGESYLNLVNAAYDEALKQVNDETVDDIRSIADFVMFVVPSGTRRDDNDDKDEGTFWKAFAAIGGQQSVFNDQWGGKLSAMAHELGHNWGMHHAYANGIEYLDVSGYMGTTSEKDFYPARCFNAYNHWFLGWYSDRSVVVDPGNPRLYNVAAFVDYNKIQDNDEYYHVLLRVGDLYMQYNRQRDFNRDTGEKGDMITIVKKQENGTDLLAGLDLDSPIFEEPMGGNTLIVQVCQVIVGNGNTPDAMQVSIGYDTSRCVVSAPTAAPIGTSRPTERSSLRPPTSPPSQHPPRLDPPPTSGPSQLSSLHPSSFLPTAMPTPTRLSSLHPSSFLPTTMPTPTRLSTIHPTTFLPTAMPTTPAPSPHPSSSSPTKLPPPTTAPPSATRVPIITSPSPTAIAVDGGQKKNDDDDDDVDNDTNGTSTAGDQEDSSTNMPPGVLAAIFGSTLGLALIVLLLVFLLFSCRSWRLRSSKLGDETETTVKVKNRRGVGEVAADPTAAAAAGLKNDNRDVDGFSTFTICAHGIPRQSQHGGTVQYPPHCSCNNVKCSQEEEWSTTAIG